MTEQIKIRSLNTYDLQTYKQLRLELLQKEPTNFGSSFEEESAFEDQMWINRLTKDNILTIGAFDHDELIGIVLAVFNPRQKLCHVATLNSVYVKQRYRHQGIAKQMILFALEHIKSRMAEIVVLSVVTTNTEAVNLYKKLGFYIYGEDKKSIKYLDEYLDQYLMKKEL